MIIGGSTGYMICLEFYTYAEWDMGRFILEQAT